MSTEASPHTAAESGIAPGRNPARPPAISDPKRLAEVRRLALLDTPPELVFDRLTRLTARLLDAPMVMATLIDRDRIFLKSSFGLDPIMGGRREAPIDSTFCQFVVPDGGPLIIEDARTDPLVARAAGDDAEPATRGYVGIGLRAGTEHVLGTFAVLTIEPRRWRPDEIALIQELAAAVDAHLETRMSRTAAARADRLTARTGDALAEIAAGASASEAVESLARDLDELIAPMRVTVLLASDDGRVAVAAGTPLADRPETIRPVHTTSLAKLRSSDGLKAALVQSIAGEHGRPIGGVIAFAPRGHLPDAWERSVIRAGARVAGVAAARDRAASQHARLEEQLRHTQKMEALGALAGGVSHDFNNLLTAIGGHAELLREEAVSEDGRELIEEIVAGVERSAALTGQLLAFSRRQVLRPERHELNQVVNGLTTMLKRLIPESIKVETDIGPAGWVEVDLSQLEQVMVNLALNARDAMPGGGILQISTGRRRVPWGGLGELPPGDWAWFAVSDTGMGMPQEIRERAIEPFFTTKATGTGLGLATAYGVVRQSGGFLRIDSVPGSGTTIIAHLPAVPAPAHPPRQRAAPAPLPSGSESILVVEDDQMVRKLVERILAARGFTVTAYPTPADALEAADPAQFDLLVTDVVMPGMTGPELAQQLRTRRPDLPVLFISGYAEDPRVQEAASRPGSGFLAKPFMAADLIASVRALLPAPAQQA